MPNGHKRAIAFIGTYLPRKCGIGTFNSDLCEAVSSVTDSTLDGVAVALNDIPEGYAYSQRVRFEIRQNNLSDYRLTADYLNMISPTQNLEGVVIQHEYGIYGGDCGNHLLTLMREIRKPIITTLHTILKEPSPNQLKILQEVIRLSDRVVVMSKKASDMLTEIYGTPAEKIALIPHGIPDVTFVDPNFYKDLFGVEGKKVILSFGLISRNKGIEYMIDAMPAILEKHPDTVYIILGTTHPHVKRLEGEEYRLFLEQKVQDLGIDQHVIFQNRFVELSELCEFLGACDVYVTPYQNAEQISSGTLSYALGAGKATVSTRYWYAEETLADGRGILVPFRDSNALSSAIIGLFDNEVERHAIRKRAYNYSRGMTWPNVARQYLDLLAQIKEERQASPRANHSPKKILQAGRQDLPEIDLRHLQTMTDSMGMLQHAKFSVPDRSHGYATDDNARALIVALLANEAQNEFEIEPMIFTYLSFLDYAFNYEIGRFRNFMSFQRDWLEEIGSEDSHGRSIWALGTAVALSKKQSITAFSVHLFNRSLPALESFVSPRSWAFALVGIHAYLQYFSGDTEARRVREVLAGRLFDRFKTNAVDDWPWLEDALSYDNGKLPHALLLSGRWLHNNEMIDMGLRALDWLFRIQTSPEGHLSTVGTNGWYVRGGEKARFDQQPIEANAMLEAALEAYRITRDERWMKEAYKSLNWFLGRNDLQQSLYDPRTGGCRDGLHPDSVNQNQGAESTLAWLMSLLLMYEQVEDLELEKLPIRGTEAAAPALTPGTPRQPQS
jgi:glycosyltransferase involved in cell wall biosynthesis